MKIILLKKVPNLGEKGEIRVVSDGYARNFLFPKNLAKIATEKNIEQLEKETELQIQKAESDLVRTQKLAERLENLELEIKAKVNNDGKLFGAVAKTTVLEKLKAKGIKELKESQIKFHQPIKELGEYEILINLPHGLEARLKIIVMEKKDKAN